MWSNQIKINEIKSNLRISIQKNKTKQNIVQKYKQNKVLTGMKVNEAYC